MLVHTKIQKWGNGLALRVSGAIRDIPHFQEGTLVKVEVNEEGLIVKKVNTSPKHLLPYTEKELLAGMSPFLAHADLLATPLDNELGEP
jgi:antitoxin MazE